MKAQIAIIGVGLAITAGVAYAELKPAKTAPQITSTQPSNSPQPQKQDPIKSAPAQPQQKLVNPNSNNHPKVPNGGGEGGEGGEHGGWFGGEDD